MTGAAAWREAKGVTPTSEIALDHGVGAKQRHRRWRDFRRRDVAEGRRTEATGRLPIFRAGFWMGVPFQGVPLHFCFSFLCGVCWDFDLDYDFDWILGLYVFVFIKYLPRSEATASEGKSASPERPTNAASFQTRVRRGRIGRRTQAEWRLITGDHLRPW